MIHVLSQGRFFYFRPQLLQGRKPGKENKMKKFITALAAGSMALSLAACSSSDSADAGNADKGEAQEILIGISPDYPPYESKNTEGDIEGFDVDMTKWLFDYLNENGHNYTYEFVELSFDTIISSLQAGQIDLGISGFTYDEDREGIFSDSYYDSAQVIIVNSGSDIKSSADLKGKKVGAQQGTTGESVANTVDAADVQAISDAKVLMENLKAEGIDAVIIDKAVADSYAANGDYTVIDEKLLDEENLIYTTEDHKELLDEINTAIKAFKESDDYAKLTEKWFVSTNE